MEVNSCDILAYKERLFGVTSMIRPSQTQESPIIVYNEFLLNVIDDVRAYGSWIS